MKGGRVGCLPADGCAPQEVQQAAFGAQAHVGRGADHSFQPGSEAVEHGGELGLDGHACQFRVRIRKAAGDQPAQAMGHGVADAFKGGDQIREGITGVIRLVLGHVGPEGRYDQLLLSCPAPVERTEADAGRLGDVLHPQSVVAALLKESKGVFEGDTVDFGLAGAATVHRLHPLTVT